MISESGKVVSYTKQQQQKKILKPVVVGIGLYVSFDGCDRDFRPHILVQAGI